MRFSALSLLALLLIGCRQTTPPPAPLPHPVPRAVVASAAAPLRSAPAPVSARPAPAYPPAPAAATRSSHRDITFEGVAFDSRKHRLIVADQTGGPGSLHLDAASAARTAGGIAAINAGYFTPEGDPLGLVVSGNQSTGSWNSASALGSGIWHSDSAGNTAISRREALGAQRARSMAELLQAGPMLVENHRPVPGLEATRQAVRSVIAWDGDSRWWIGRSSPCTLADLGRALAEGSPAGWKIRHALNLDGGRSSDLWVSGTVTGGPLTRRAAWNRPVRNFLILMPPPPGM
jgi:uncharacterized protein YigE (DUF2233 family)